MKFLNSCDIDYALSRLGDRDDNLGSAVRILAALRDDVNEHSDGWHCWRVPVRAARQLIALVERGTDVHATELRKALAPVRAFYTRAHRGDYGGPFPRTNRGLEY